MPIKQVSVELGWGPAKLSGVWEPEDAERKAAWELYVELVTRIAVVPLRPGEGILREALNSLSQLFGSTREILRAHGPDVARPAAPGRLRFGYLAIWVLNGVVRPTLALWHPELQRWEAGRPADRPVADHEAAWPRAGELRADLEEAREVLLDYARLLAQACDAPALIDATDEVLRAMDEQGAQG